MVVALTLAPSPPWPWRVLTAGLVLLAAWRPVAASVFGRGPAAVRSFEWAADGQWRIAGERGGSVCAVLAPATATIGPFLLLLWREEGQPAPGRRRYALLDAGTVSPALFRALRARLKLTAHRP